MLTSQSKLFLSCQIFQIMLNVILFFANLNVKYNSTVNAKRLCYAFCFTFYYIIILIKKTRFIGYQRWCTKEINQKYTFEERMLSLTPTVTQKSRLMVTRNKGVARTGYTHFRSEHLHNFIQV